MIKRILIGLLGTEFTDSEIQHGLELAKLHGAELTGITVIDTKELEEVGPIPLGAEEFAQRLRERRIVITGQLVEQAIKKFESACAGADVNHRVRRETGDPFDLMVSHSRYHDMMIFGLRSLFHYGVVDDPCDMLCQLIGKGVRPILAVAEQPRKVRKAIIAYNGSMESARAMRHFIQIRPWPDVQAQIVCFDKDAGEAKQLLADAAEYCRSHGVNAQTLQLKDSPREGILKSASDWNADLIVMGNSVRSVFLRRVLGDTVLHVIQHSDRPIFLSQ